MPPPPPTTACVVCTSVLTQAWSLTESAQGYLTADAGSSSAPRIRLFALHSDIPLEDQEAVFSGPAHDTCHVVLASNIAESSLTLPSVHMVVDTGLRRSPVYSPELRLTQLQTTWCSQASLRQRGGRAARTMPGTVLRLFPRLHFSALSEYDTPQLLEQPLAKVYLYGHRIAKQLQEDVVAVLRQLIQPPNLDAIIEALEVGPVPWEGGCGSRRPPGQQTGKLRQTHQRLS